MTPATRALDEVGIAYRTVSYRHDDATNDYGSEAAAALGLDPDAVFKTLLADVDGRLVVACVPVAGRLDLKALARAAGGKKAAMADPVEAERSTGYVLGGISPFGQRKALPTFVDEICEALDAMYVSGGRRGLEIVVAPGDFLRAVELTTSTAATLAPIST